MNNTAKRIISIALALLMAVSVVPVSVFATVDGTDDVEAIVESGASQSNTLLGALMEMNAVTVRYLGNTVLGDDSIYAIVAEMDAETKAAAIADIKGLADTFDKVSGYSLSNLSASEGVRTLECLWYALNPTMGPAMQAGVMSYYAEGASDETAISTTAVEECPTGSHVTVIDEEIPALCEDTGLTSGSHCSVCGKVIVAQQVIPALGHDLVSVDAKVPTYTKVGWDAYVDCTRCAYSTYVEIPVLPTPSISDFDTFAMYLALAEEMAYMYTSETPGADPVDLIIKYIRTGVERYNSGSWGIMAGYEDAAFADFVATVEDQYNSVVPPEEFLAISSLKNLENFYLPNGEYADMGHIFGTLDITYHNDFGVNHADVAGWAGDLVDLLEFASYGKVSGTVEEMVAEITENYLGVTPPPEIPGFNELDIRGDMDALFLAKMIEAMDYEQSMLYWLFIEYFSADLTSEERAVYMLSTRFNGASLRSDVRDAVYNAYTGNKVVATLEGTRDFGVDNVADLRKACCYAFADYICKLGGDYVESTTNPYFEPFSTITSNLAPGITQTVKQATTADGKQTVYYIATADVSREDVHFFANYKDNNPTEFGMQTVLDQANAAQNKYGDPDSEHYITNYNVIVSTNGTGYNMSTGETSGVLVMNGVEYHPINSNGFVGVLKDGTPVIGTQEEYNTIYKGQVQEAIAGFGTMLVKDGKINVAHTDNYADGRASRTAFGITKTGKIVLMVMDGRQEPVSCGGSLVEIAQVMLDAGCVYAMNMDGGGSTTYVSKAEGADELSLLNRPSDGYMRSVSTSMMLVSTAPSSTAFDHAVIKSEYDYLTIGTAMQMTADGVSATGNAADIPEGATWAVSNERYGTITEDGVFTATRNGSVEICLMLGDEVIGSKTVNVVFPDNLYFNKTNMDAVYGQKAALPIIALYQNKPVAIKDGDVIFQVVTENAGVVEGLYFIGTESSGIKNTDVIATLASNTSVTAKINIALYNQGEATFDFDQATGGDRLLAWYRKVTNATTDDDSVYDIISPDEDMVTSYTFAIDMTQIPIPQQLEDLIYMLPGAGDANASAWSFLLQLAERVSVLSEVRPTLRFDPDVEVDYSDLTIVEFDEETNSLTLLLNWIDQTKAIDPAMANPLCIVSGIKLTPKDDAQWTDSGKLVIENSGEISYDIYLRANALYSFALKPENQETYGLKPFVNPDIPSEKGGYFGSVYADFADSYTLVNVLKNGWYNEDGGFAYYVEGERLTGIKEADGYYYNFGENGVNVGQTKYVGLFYDEVNECYRYAKAGLLQSGWHTIGADWYYFDSAKKAVSGTRLMGGVYYDFEETGKLISGEWANTLGGVRYYYGPGYYYNGWQEIDGQMYYFQNGYRATDCCIFIHSIGFYSRRRWYRFDENGIYEQLTKEGLYNINGLTYYLVDGVHQVGLHKVDGDYYFFCYNGYAVTGSKYAWETHCDLPCNTYFFGEDGKMVNGIYESEDGVYYYVNGKIDYTKAGLTKVGDDYYFISTTGKCATGTKYAWATNCDLPCGEYEFGTDGKLLNGIGVREDGIYYFYNGKIDYTKAGLTKVGDDYYFVSTIGRCAVNRTYYAWATNCDLPCGSYEFGPDGKMLQGVVEKEDGHYFYYNGRVDYTKAGLTKVGDDYYFVSTTGKCATGKYNVWATNCDLPAGEYEFGPDGKMLQGLVEKDGALYYYVNGRLGNKPGLTKIGDDYYFVATTGKCATGKYYAWATNCDLPCSEYEFGPDGKMLHGFVEKDGVVYCYVNGKLGGNNPGLAKFGDDYYFVATTGRCATGTKYAWATNCDLPVGNYEFGPDGKMYNGFVTKDDGIYYYEYGKIGKMGLNYIDGHYYFVRANGKLVTNQSYYVWETNGLLIEITYKFNELGQIIG